MYYFLSIVATLLFSLQFMFNEKFQKENSVSLNSTLKFSLYSSIAGAIILYIINGFKLEFTWFSFAISLIFSIISLVLNYMSLNAFKYANLSVFSVFMMIGGMIIPFIFGIACGEPLTITGVICCILIVVAVLISMDYKKESKKAIFYYLAVFVLNGTLCIVLKVHQMFNDINVDSSSFMIIARLILIAMSSIMILCSSNKSFKVNKVSVFSAVMFSGVNGIGNLLLLISLIYLPASVQYPITTGGTIVFSVVISVLLGEKNTLKNYLSAGIAFVATLFMMF